MPQDMPKACHKEALYTYLNTISNRDIKEVLYPIILKNPARKHTVKTLNDAKNVKVLFKNEVKEVLIALGELEG